MNTPRFLFQSLLAVITLAAASCAPTQGSGLGGAIPSEAQGQSAHVQPAL